MTTGDAMEMSELRASAASVQVYLRGVKYPSARQSLIDHAKSAEAPDGVLKVLSRMTDKEYQNSLDVQREIDRATEMKAYEANLGTIGPAAGYENTDEANR